MLLGLAGDLGWLLNSALTGNAIDMTCHTWKLAVIVRTKVGGSSVDDAVQLCHEDYVSAKKSNIEPKVLSSFMEACMDARWGVAIDREYNALVKRGTWEYDRRTASKRPVSYTWNLTLKVVDAVRDEYLAKDRCCLRGDRQKAWVDLDPKSVFAPLASHESLRMLIAFAAANELVLEAADISNAYLPFSWNS